MSNPYQFRDYLIGWLADQLQAQRLSRVVALTLYEAVIFATDEEEAFIGVAEGLGQEQARRLRSQSRQVQDELVETARPLIEQLRDDVLAESLELSDFYQFFLNPFKEGCVPDGYEESLNREICWMFQTLYCAASNAVLEAHGWQPYVVIEPSYEDASHIVVLARSVMERESHIFLFDRWTKAWHVRYATLHQLAEALLDIRDSVEQAAPEAILGYHLAQTVREVLNPSIDEAVEWSTTPLIPGAPIVVIDVYGGVATVVQQPPGIEVRINDFDVGIPH